MIRKADPNLYTGLDRAIRWHRRSAEISQKDFARILGVSPNTVLLWEKGITRPSVDNLIKIARILKVPEQDLLHPSENILNARIKDDEYEIVY